MTEEFTAQQSRSYRRYEKGERRFKHVGTKPVAEILFEDGNPKKSVGKCPTGISDTLKEGLLNDAIEGSNGDRDVEFPAKLYNVLDGAIYEARTSTRGYSYHGFPYRGKLAKSLLDMLEQKAESSGCYTEFRQWVKAHIQVHGE